jgi:hypothetical protein
MDGLCRVTGRCTRGLCLLSPRRRNRTKTAAVALGRKPAGVFIPSVTAVTFLLCNLPVKVRAEPSVQSGGLAGN